MPFFFFFIFVFFISRLSIDLDMISSSFETRLYVRKIHVQPEKHNAEMILVIFRMAIKSKNENKHGDPIISALLFIDFIMINIAVAGAPGRNRVTTNFLME